MRWGVNLYESIHVKPKTNLIYSDSKQSCGFVRIGAWDWLERGMKTFLEIEVFYFLLEVKDTQNMHLSKPKFTMKDLCMVLWLYVTQ